MISLKVSSHIEDTFVYRPLTGSLTYKSDNFHGNIKYNHCVLFNNTHERNFKQIMNPRLTRVKIMNENLAKKILTHVDIAIKTLSVST